MSYSDQFFYTQPLLSPTLQIKKIEHLYREIGGQSFLRVHQFFFDNDCQSISKGGVGGFVTPNSS